MSGPRPLALVTGASSGIGREIARLVARDDYDLVLVSRDETKLGEVADECAAVGAKCLIVKEDLSVPGASARVMKKIGGRDVDLLINNAGFGLHGSFWKTDAAAETAMVQTHVLAALDLSRAVLPGMVKRGSGSIVNVSSLYAFVPGPRQAVYAATKAFLFSLSLSLQAELAGTGVTVTAVLPGPTRSEFHARAGLGAKRGATAESVARSAWRAAKAGRALVVPGAGNKAFVALARLLPSASLGPLMKTINRARGV
jgi:short-subunit dehydrogenase